MPVVSIIVPVYKVEPYLRRCVDSILAQTFTDFELILVDDGSPDNCGAICDDYAEKDSRIHVIHQKNGGLSAARNAGIDWAFANSNSRWLSFVDSDDWVHPDFLQRLIIAAEQSGMHVASCLYSRVLPNGDELDRPDEKLPQEIISFDSYFAKTGWGYTPYIACAKIYDKQAFSIIRYPLGKITEDLFTTYKVLYPYESIVRVNSVLYFYYQTEKSIMRDHWNPKRLDEIEASEQLLRFMREKGFHSAEKTSYDRFLWVLRTQISMIRSEKNSRFALLERRLLRKGRRLLLSWYDKSAPISEYNEDYEFFFPKLNYFYWTCRGILGKLKRMVKK